jgi:signal transduction histidine kinase
MRVMRRTSRDTLALAAALAVASAGLAVTASRRRDEPEEDDRALLATAAHELRTPLTSLHLRLDLLVQALEGEAPDLIEARQHAERANALSNAVIRLANELLQLTGAPATGLRRPVDIVQIARQVLDEFEGVKGPTVVLQLRAVEPVWAVSDPVAVAQILRVLIDNALRFAPAGTVVSVSAGRRGRRCELTVADCGPGIAPADRERIFRRFQGASRDGRFGLGLAIGRDLAHRLGGDVRLSSAASPTAFTLDLPAATESTACS